jgi:hypothetical protein
MEQLFRRIQTRKTLQKESTLTFGIVVVLLLMASFVGCGVYILINTFFS